MVEPSFFFFFSCEGESGGLQQTIFRPRHTSTTLGLELNKITGCLPRGIGGARAADRHASFPCEGTSFPFRLLPRFSSDGFAALVDIGGEEEVVVGIDVPLGIPAEGPVVVLYPARGSFFSLVVVARGSYEKGVGKGGGGGGAAPAEEEEEEEEGTKGDATETVGWVGGGKFAPTERPAGSPPPFLISSPAFEVSCEVERPFPLRCSE